MMGIRLQLSQTLSVRQEIQTRLQQSLLVKQAQRLELKQYLKLEEFFTGLYGEAIARESVKKYAKHGMRFEYALVSVRDVSHLKRYGMAFSHCLINPFDKLIGGRKYALAKGTWLLFVVCDMYPKMPQRFLEYAAVHERGEQVTLGEHHLATKLEFAIAQKECKLREYAAWIEQLCPEKFADVFSYQRHVELPDSEELQEALEIFASSKEAKTVKRFIEYFEWPASTLRKLDWYHAQNNAAAELLQRAFETAHRALYSRGTTIAELVRDIRNALTQGLDEIAQKFPRRLSAERMDPAWVSARKNLDAKFIEVLQLKQGDPAYIAQVMEAGITGGLPSDGALALSFHETLCSLKVTPF